MSINLFTHLSIYICVHVSVFKHYRYFLTLRAVQNIDHDFFIFYVFTLKLCEKFLSSKKQWLNRSYTAVIRGKSSFLTD